MKTRNGFVSNSSSSSFIIHWRMRDFGEKCTLKQAISCLFESNIYDEEKNEWVAEKEWRKGEKEKFEEIEKITRENADGSFTTIFWTPMRNDMDDFGDTAKSMALALIGSKNSFEIIDTSVEDEG